ncbi:TPA: hypothetical protein NHH84_003057 [Legionella pneumophila]|nr:hypothetical protein [Legionella pneumophila]
MALRSESPVLFVLIPHATNLATLIAFIFLFAITANSYKSVAESLTPTFSPQPGAATANAIAKVATSLTIIVSSLISLLIVNRSVELAFAIPAILMVAGVTIVALSIRENRSPGYRRAVAESVRSQAEAPGRFAGLSENSSVIETIVVSS